jgi:hypothetical protein
VINPGFDEDGLFPIMDETEEPAIPVPEGGMELTDSRTDAHNLRLATVLQEYRRFI